MERIHAEYLIETPYNVEDAAAVLADGGMASGIAGSMGKLATLGLGAAVFSPWMNISGSLLANYWRKKRKRKNDWKI